MCLKQDVKPARVRSKSFHVVHSLEKDLLRGKYPPGSILPTDQKLAELYNVSRMTMRKVLAELETQGRLIRQPQRGVMVPLMEAVFPEQTPRIHSHQKQTSRKVTLAAVWSAEPDANVVGINQGVQQYAEEAGLNFQLFLSREGHARALEVLCNAERYGIDGLIVQPHPMPEYLDAFRSLAQKRIPVVVLGKLRMDEWSSSVDCDNAGGVYQATQYLIEKYHRPVYMLAAERDLQSSNERYLGYRRAMEDAGYAGLVEDHTVWIDVSIADPTYWPMTKKNYAGLAAGRALLERAGTELPLSVMCNNDYNAMGLYEACQERNLRVGQDVAIIGFDDLPLAKRLAPPLTTVRQNMPLNGYTAARLLHQLIRGELTSPEIIHLPVELIQRESA